MQVILKAISLSYLISFFVYQSTFAANELVSDKINKNIKKGGVIEKSTNKIIQYPSTTAINLKAKQVILVDYATGKILLEKNAYDLMSPSSMTKIMTSYIIQEQLKIGYVSLDSEFIVSKKAWKMGGSKSFMPLGKKVRLEDILRGIIIQSGNDASIVAAEGMYGSEKSFVDIMNAKAKEIGMKKTYFSNSTGFSTNNHYSTAYDVALLGTELIKTHPEFYSMYSEKNFTFGLSNKGKPITQENRNPLLYKDLGCDGIKTGYTVSGGYGIVASFVDNNRRYIMVINGLNSTTIRASESEKIIYWVKHNFINKEFYSKGYIVGEADVLFGKKSKVLLTLSNKVQGLALRSEQHEISTKLKVLSPLPAPLKAGDVVGKLLIKINGEEQEVPVVVNESVEKTGVFHQIIISVRLIFLNILATFGTAEKI